ncbi:hypothetical protein [Arthrobacter sp. D2-10]
MEFWQVLVVTLIGSGAAVLTAALGFRDLGMRRRLETSKQFVSLFAAAHGRPSDGRDGVGVGEQIATIHLIADFAVKEDVLKNAAREGLREISTWGQAIEIPHDIAVAAISNVEGLTHEQVVEAASKAVVSLKHRTESYRKLAAAATEALKRLE